MTCLYLVACEKGAEAKLNNARRRFIGFSWTIYFLEPCGARNVAESDYADDAMSVDSEFMMHHTHDHLPILLPIIGTQAFCS